MELPRILFGTYQLSNEQAFTMCREAFSLGYGGVDTAVLYKNEEGVGRAISEYPDRYVITKIPARVISKIKNKPKEKQIEIFRECINQSLQKLKKIDLLLLHAYVTEEAWEILCSVKGDIPYIGVSNYNVEQLEKLNPKPYANQIEINPFCYKREIVDYCQKNNIKIIAHTSLTRTHKFDNEILINLSQKYNLTIPQIMFKWALQKNFHILPRTTNLDHLIENITNIPDVDLTELDNIDENFILFPKFK